MLCHHEENNHKEFYHHKKIQIFLRGNINSKESL